MKILLTGGAGFIGSHVVDLYIKHGYEVLVVDDLSTGRISNLNPAAKFYQLDIRSSELEDIFAREKPDIVNHHAAQMDVRRSVVEPMYDADVNIVGSLNILECSRKYDIQRFIYISSGGAVYGEPVYLPCDEAHPVDPICQYGASKHTVEHYLYMYKENYGIDYVVLRYPNVYGPRQDPFGEAGVVAIFTQQMLADEQVTINGDGNQERDFVTVFDCARANLLALTNSHASGIYNLGSGRGTTVNQIFEHLKSISGYQKSPHHGLAKLGETRRIFLDANRIQQELDWQQEINLEEGLRQTVEYFQTVERKTGAADSLEENEVQMRSSLVTRQDSSEVSDVSNRYLNTPRSVISHPLEILRALEKILVVTGSQLDLPEALLRIASESIGVASGSIVMLDEQGDIRDVSLLHLGNIRGDDPEKCIKLIQNGLAGWVIEKQQATIVTNTQKDPRWLQMEWEHAEHSCRSAVSIPLLEGGKTRGVLTLVHEQENSLSLEHLALVATVTGIFVLRTDLYRERIDLQPGPQYEHQFFKKLEKFFL
jgi:UDP-glucose 4-epimerase